MYLHIMCLYFHFGWVTLEAFFFFFHCLEMLLRLPHPLVLGIVDTDELLPISERFTNQPAIYDHVHVVLEVALLSLYFIR